MMNYRRHVDLDTMVGLKQTSRKEITVKTVLFICFEQIKVLPYDCGPPYGAVENETIQCI